MAYYNPHITWHNQVVYPLRPKQRRLFSLLMLVCFWIESVLYARESACSFCSIGKRGWLYSAMSGWVVVWVTIRGLCKHKSSSESGCQTEKGWHDEFTGIILRNLDHAGHRMPSTVAFWHFVGDKINRSTKFQRNLVTCFFHQPTPSEISRIIGTVHM